MGDISTNCKIHQDFKYEGNDWWAWWIWIDGSDAELDQVDHVVYTLHPTFPKPVKKVTSRETKFRLESVGWGTFVIHAKLVFKNKQEAFLEHELYLAYPDGTKNVE